MTAPNTQNNPRTIRVNDVATSVAATPDIPADLNKGDKLVGLATLNGGTLAINLPGVLASSFAQASVKTQGGTLGAGGVKVVCTLNTLTISAIDLTGGAVATDTSTYQYEITI